MHNFYSGFTELPIYNLEIKGRISDLEKSAHVHNVYSLSNLLILRKQLFINNSG